ncbi:hypothetical protein [Ferruginibacter sp.]
MRLPQPYKDVKEIKDKIRANNNFYKTFYNEGFRTSSYPIIKNSVSGNTFRSEYFDAGKYLPSSIFRTWAQDVLFEEKLYTQIIICSSRKKYALLHKKIVTGLQKYWKKNTGIKMKIGYCCKLFDLLMKIFPNYINLNKTQRERLKGMVNVPLDKYTLNAIRTIWNRRWVALKKKKIESDSTMSFIGDDYDLHREIQKCIADSVRFHHPIEFDLLVWNRPNNGDSFQHELKKLKKK